LSLHGHAITEIVKKTVKITVSLPLLVIHVGYRLPNEYNVNGSTGHGWRRVIEARDPSNINLLTNIDPRPLTDCQLWDRASIHVRILYEAHICLIIYIISYHLHLLRRHSPNVQQRRTTQHIEYYLKKNKKK